MRHPKQNIKHPLWDRELHRDVVVGMTVVVACALIASFGMFLASFTHDVVARCLVDRATGIITARVGTHTTMYAPNQCEAGAVVIHECDPGLKSVVTRTQVCSLGCQYTDRGGTSLAASCRTTPAPERGAPTSLLMSKTIGVELQPIGPDNTEFPFLDLMKQSSTCVKSTHSFDTDTLGNVRSLKSNQVCDRVVISPQAAPLFPSMYHNTLVVRYDGTGTLEYIGGIHRIATAPGRDVLTIDQPDFGQTGLTIRLSALPNSSDYIRNIHVIPAGGICGTDVYTVHEPTECPKQFFSFEQQFRTLIFSPLFLSHVQQTIGEKPAHSDGARGIIQFGSWVDADASIDAVTWAGHVPASILVQLANTLHMNPWFSINPLTSDTGLSTIATTVRDSLDPRLLVFVEPIREEPQTSSTAEKQLQSYVQAAKRIFTTWDKSFGSMSQLAHVFQGTPSDTSGALPLFAQSLEELHVQVLTIPAIFSSASGKKNVSPIATSVAGAVDDLEQVIVPQLFDQMDVFRAITEAHQVILATAVNAMSIDEVLLSAVPEGGTKHELSTDNRLYDIYTTYLSGWQHHGGQVFLRPVVATVPESFSPVERAFADWVVHSNR